ncbi:uncharacterized protein LOC131622365 [Vicia villosa]|uniref:uncharacterized protein LOC131605322 n=1 Tax=Vicia villosa TaxID=3911 RepID=UPI00273CA4A3|nr:uncharacterized protein LOC131605322 [Vicia villosa]XP_058749375.1 uncharacterized protein LOC131622365 [Vicia villosa]
MKMETEPLHHQFSSPSFSSYSSDSLAQTATRVIHTDDSSQQNHNINTVNDDFEFDFTFLSTDSVSSVPADDIFHNGQITPTYPLFDQSLLNGVVSRSHDLPETAPRRRRLPLKKLMEDEGEGKELDGVAAGTYCVWTPPCKKSSSTGSEAKRWKFRDLLLRSHSDGKKDSLLFFTSGGKKNSAVHDVAGAAKDGFRSKRKLGISWIIQ